MQRQGARRAEALAEGSVELAQAMVRPLVPQPGARARLRLLACVRAARGGGCGSERACVWV